MRLEKNIKPVDVGIWKFLRGTTREDTAVYQCRGCGARIQSNLQILPDACPFCDYDYNYEKLDNLIAGLFTDDNNMA